MCKAVTFNELRWCGFAAGFAVLTMASLVAIVSQIETNDLIITPWQDYYDEFKIGDTKNCDTIVFLGAEEQCSSAKDECYVIKASSVIVPCSVFIASILIACATETGGHTRGLLLASIVFTVTAIIFCLVNVGIVATWYNNYPLNWQEAVKQFDSGSCSNMWMWEYTLHLVNALAASGENIDYLGSFQHYSQYETNFNNNQLDNFRAQTTLFSDSLTYGVGFVLLSINVFVLTCLVVIELLLLSKKQAQK